MKKLNITKEQFDRSRYLKHKYGNLEFVSESGKLFKTDTGKILKFKESRATGVAELEPVNEGYLALTSDQAYDELGGKGEVARQLRRLNRVYGKWAVISIEPCIDEENPEDMDFLNVQIQMKPGMEEREDKVTEGVWNYLNQYGLDFDYECGGDGEFGPISSYRIRLA